MILQYIFVLLKLLGCSSGAQNVVPIQIAQKVVRHGQTNSVILETFLGFVQHRLDL